MNDVGNLRWTRSKNEDGSTRYDLPPRPVNLTLSTQALYATALGLGLTLLSGSAIAGLIATTLVALHYVSVFWLFVCLALLALGLRWLRDGLTDLPPARVSIEIDRERLRVVRRLGWFRRGSSSPLQQLRSLQIEGSGLQRVLPYPQPIRTHRLVATGTAGPMTLADTFPITWLEELGNDVRQHLHRKDVPLEIFPEQPAEEKGLQPAKSQARLLWSDNRMSLQVPPLGVASSLGSLFLIAGTVGMVSFMFTSVGMIQPDTNPAIFILPALYFALFIAVRALLQAAHSTTTITIDASGLHLHRRHFRDFDNRHWSLNEIADIGIGKSRIPVNKGSPALPDVLIRFHDGLSVHLLGGYPREEIQWIVHTLQEGIARQPKQSEPEIDELLKRIPGRRLTARRIGTKVFVNCPRLGIPFKMCLYILMGLGILTGTGFGIWALWEWDKPDDVHIAYLIALWALCGVGLLFGIGIPIESFIDATRTRLFEIDAGRLLIHERTILRERERVWKREELKAIDVGPLLSLAADWIPAAGLRLRLQNDREIALGQWHTIAELLWLAAIVRKTMNVPLPPLEPARYNM